VRLANKLAKLLGTEDLEKEKSQDDAPFVFLFPMVKVFSGFGMVLLFSRNEALFPAAMIVWLRWLKESFF
jgi:hypothetical protein